MFDRLAKYAIVSIFSLLAFELSNQGSTVEAIFTAISLVALIAMDEAIRPKRRKNKKEKK